MNKLFEIGEIGLLQDIPAELTFMTTENKLLKQNNDKLKFEKALLAWCIFALVFYIIWREIKNRSEDVINKKSK